MQEAPYFEVCSCQRHGRVMLKNGLTSLEFCSKDFALCMVRLAADPEFQQIDPADLPKVITEVNASVLPDHAGDVDPVLVYVLYIMNIQMADIPGATELWNGEARHAFLATSKVTARDVPVDFMPTVKENMVRANQMN